MAYFSTRGESCVIASQAVLRGLAPDGGLYVPAMFPAFTPEQMADLYGKDYAGRAADVLKVYLEDYTSAEIEQAVRAAYSPERFDDPRITPLKKIDDATWIMELFHGPTLAFKDIALQLLPHLMKLAAVKNGERCGRDQLHRVLPAGRGQRRAEAADGDDGGKQHACDRREGEL